MYGSVYIPAPVKHRAVRVGDGWRVTYLSAWTSQTLRYSASSSISIFSIFSVLFALWWSGARVPSLPSLPVISVCNFRHCGRWLIWRPSGCSGCFIGCFILTVTYIETLVLFINVCKCMGFWSLIHPLVNFVWWILRYRYFCAFWRNSRYRRPRQSAWRHQFLLADAVLLSFILYVCLCVCTESQRPNQTRYIVAQGGPRVGGSKGWHPGIGKFVRILLYVLFLL